MKIKEEIRMQKIYQLYSQKIYPKIEDTRGSHRLKMILRELSLKKLEKVNPENITDPFEEEWDNLIIIDSCRQDLFQESSGEKGWRYSKGSATPEYIEKNYSEGDFSDYVYIAGNPFLSKESFKELTGRKRGEVFHTVFETFNTGWDEQKGTVKPEETIQEAITAQKLFPDKKLIIHFMPPHYPFTTSVIEEDKDIDPWVLAENGKASPKKVINAYKDTIDYIIPYIEELNEELNGKTILTSDHGNYIGEAGVYGHPRDRKEKAVKKVPWVKMNNFN